MIKKVKLVFELKDEFINKIMKDGKLETATELEGALKVMVGGALTQGDGPKLYSDGHVEIEEEKSKKSTPKNQNPDFSKLQPGDKVRIKRFIKRPFHWNDEGEMDKYMGQIVTINELDEGSQTFDFYICADKGAGREKWLFAWSDVKEIVEYKSSGITRETFERLQSGDKVRIKRYIERPSRWNPNGKMDKYMGEVVTIEENDGNRVFVYDSDCNYRWAFDIKDIDEVISMQDEGDDCCEHCPCNCKKKK